MSVFESLLLPIFYFILTSNQDEGHFDFLNSLYNDNSSNINEMGKKGCIYVWRTQQGIVKSV
jgi:hypothetical protein